jgi:hypothetical protein
MYEELCKTSCLMLDSAACLDRFEDCLWYSSNKSSSIGQCINRVCGKSSTPNECESLKIDNMMEIPCVLIKGSSINEVCVVEHSVSCDFYKSSSGCTWSVSNGDPTNIVCNWNESEGSCSVSQNCSSLGIIGVECLNYNSSRGKCFLNGDGNLTTIDKQCSDVVDVINCEQLQSLLLCMYANRNTYTNLVSSSEDELVCLWDMENQVCMKKEKNASPSKSNSAMVIIIVVVVVVSVILISIMAVIMIFLYRKSLKLKLGGENNSNGKRVEEMNMIRNEVESSGNEQSRKKGGIYYLFYILISMMLKIKRVNPFFFF